MEWHYWAVLGIVLTVVELMVPARIFIWFGLGALIVGICVFFVPDMTLFSQLIVWGTMVLLFVVSWFCLSVPEQRMRVGATLARNRNARGNARVSPREAAHQYVEPSAVVRK